MRRALLAAEVEGGFVWAAETFGLAAGKEADMARAAISLFSMVAMVSFKDLASRPSRPSTSR